MARYSKKSCTPRRSPPDQEAKGVEGTRRNFVGTQTGKLPIPQGDGLCPPLPHGKVTRSGRGRWTKRRLTGNSAWRDPARGRAVFRLFLVQLSDFVDSPQAVEFFAISRFCNSLPEPVTPRCWSHRQFTHGKHTCYRSVHRARKLSLCEPRSANTTSLKAPRRHAVLPQRGSHKQNTLGSLGPFPFVCGGSLTTPEAGQAGFWSGGAAPRSRGDLFVPSVVAR